MPVAGKIEAIIGGKPADPVDGIASVTGRGNRRLNGVGGGGAVVNGWTANVIRGLVRRHARAQGGGYQQQDDPRKSH